MKKTLVVLVLALFVAGSALAANHNWTIQLCTDNGNNGQLQGPLNTWGVDPACVDGKDNYDVVLGATTNAQAKMAVPHPEFPSPPTPPYYKNDRRAPFTSETKVWNFIIWLGTNYTQSALRLKWGIPNPANALDPNLVYKLVMINDPTGTYEPGVIYTFPQGAAGPTYSNGSGLGYIMWTQNLGVLKMADADAINNGIKMALVVEPIPEPSSLLALTSGLAGLAGFAIRRRA